MDKYTVRSASDGSVDVSASVANYHNALAAWVTSNEVSTEAVREAIDTVFDQQASDTRLTLPVLISYTMAILNPSPSQFSAVEDRIRAFLKGEARFNSSKGKGGGVMRLALQGEPLPLKKSA